MHKPKRKEQPSTQAAGISESLESGKSAAVEMLEPSLPLMNFSRENLIDDQANEIGFSLNEPELKILKAFLRLRS
jgi:hypothetical protein